MVHCQCECIITFKAKGLNNNKKKNERKKNEQTKFFFSKESCRQDIFHILVKYYNIHTHTNVKGRRL